MVNPVKPRTTRYGRLEVDVDRILLEEFKEVAKNKYGRKRGWLRKAVEEAMKIYIKLMR